MILVLKFSFVIWWCVYFNSVLCCVEEVGKDELWNVLLEIIDVIIERNLMCILYVIWEGVLYGEKEDGVRYLLI